MHKLTQSSLWNATSKNILSMSGGWCSFQLLVMKKLMSHCCSLFYSLRANGMYLLVCINLSRHSEKKMRAVFILVAYYAVMLRQSYQRKVRKNETKNEWNTARVIFPKDECLPDISSFSWNFIFCHISFFFQFTSTLCYLHRDNDLLMRKDSVLLLISSYHPLFEVYFRLLHIDPR